MTAAYGYQLTRRLAKTEKYRRGDTERTETW